MNHILQHEETICALATAQGQGAIGVIRLSGSKTFSILNRIFSKKKVEELPAHTVHFGTIQEEGQIVDEVLVSVFKGPNSYTGEDVAEISCHGSTYILNKIMELLIHEGAKPAQAGEFTLRAFVNGKMDLSQAEAVADLIASDSEASHQMAMHQMRGGFSKEISALRQQLIDFASLIELELDFSEEDVEFADRKQLTDLVEKLNSGLSKLIQSFAAGNVLKEGVPVAIVGEPNAGKSTLLNALLNDERAIVSDIEGTTRDAIEDEVVIEGVKFRFVDTAGIRDTEDTIENMGIQKTFEKLEQAAVVLQIIDAVKNDADQVRALVSNVEAKIKNGQQHLIVANKVDALIQEGDVTSDQVHENFEDIENVIYISAKEQQNIEWIREQLLSLVNAGMLNKHDVIVTNARHYEALLKANEALQKVNDGLHSGITGDFLAMDIRQALFHLGEITGEVTTDDLLGNIFGKFCIGK